MRKIEPRKKTKRGCESERDSERYGEKYREEDGDMERIATEIRKGEQNGRKVCKTRWRESAKPTTP